MAISSIRLFVLHAQDPRKFRESNTATKSSLLVFSSSSLSYRPSSSPALRTSSTVTNKNSSYLIPVCTPWPRQHMACIHVALACSQKRKANLQANSIWAPWETKVHTTGLGGKTSIPACPLGKQLSHFACSGPSLAGLKYWSCRRVTCLLDSCLLVSQVSFKSYFPSKKIYLSRTTGWDVFRSLHVPCTLVAIKARSEDGRRTSKKRFLLLSS